MKQIMYKVVAFPRNLSVILIRLYQVSVSPDHGWLIRPLYPYGFCRYYPSCSEYGKIAIMKYGVVKGGVQTFWRLLRCNPWADPKIDINK